MEAYVGEIRAVGFNFAPQNWALCQGQIMQIRSNTALFSILGTTYGGNGTTTFALPNLCGRAIINAGKGPGLSVYPQGAAVGSEGVTLDMTQIPAHLHTITGTLPAFDGLADKGTPDNNFLATTSVSQYGEEAGSKTMGQGIIKGTSGPGGGGQAHSNMMPYLTMNYIICLVGVFPPRS
ncbi:tail fiber protein [Hymenobacter segetis]|uniref:Tail fiber protein n=1 Tax=Hymenobacter segetis TaxID=2025509 RepID=A0ABU9LSV1_9BACT